LRVREESLSFRDSKQEKGSLTQEWEALFQEYQLDRGSAHGLYSAGLNKSCCPLGDPQEVAGKEEKGRSRVTWRTAEAEELASQLQKHPKKKKEEKGVLDTEGPRNRGGGPKTNPRTPPYPNSVEGMPGLEKAFSIHA